MSATIPAVPSVPAEQAPAQPAFDPALYAAAPAASTQSSAQSPTQWKAITSLVLGIVSIVAGWTFFAPAAGLVVGILALKSEPASRTMAIWGVVLNGVMLALSLLVVVAAVVFGLAVLPFAFLTDTGMNGAFWLDAI